MAAPLDTMLPLGLMINNAVQKCYKDLDELVKGCVCACEYVCLCV